MPQSASALTRRVRGPVLVLGAGMDLTGVVAGAALKVFVQGTSPPVHLRSMKRRNDEAMKMEENVSEMMPQAMTQTNGRITSPPKTSSARVAASVVPELRMV